jgi:two-component system, OmpR family, response regulator MtrA
MTDKVMLVEDDRTVRSLVRLLLEDEGLAVVEAATGPQAVERFSNEHVDLVLLDLRLPGLNGFEVCRQLRRSSDVPIIMVTAQHDSADVVAGLEVGADDYVTKPFNDRELLARVRAQLRRRQGALSTSAPAVVAVDDVEIRVEEGRVLKAGTEISLTKTEFRLVVFFAQHLNRVLSREQLLDNVWGYADGGDNRLVDTHIGRLRTKIEHDPAHPRLIHTVRGLGYRFGAGGS